VTQPFQEIFGETQVGCCSSRVLAITSGSDEPSLYTFDIFIWENHYCEYEAVKEFKKMIAD
jgi:hypothetical protein